MTDWFQFVLNIRHDTHFNSSNKEENKTYNFKYTYVFGFRLFINDLYTYIIQHIKEF